MKNNYTLAINFDEISDDFRSAVDLMAELNIRHGELRTLNKKNFVFWSDDETDDFKSLVRNDKIKVIAAATPLFKWYEDQNDSEVRHDSFGFDPRLSLADKYQIIKRTMYIANELNIQKLRIFSELKSASTSEESFATSDLLTYALNEASRYGIDLLIENEPVCRIHTKSSIIDFLKANQSSNLKLWLDIANLIELNEQIDEAFLDAVSSRIGYIHVKDFVKENESIRYVPAGSGSIDYATLLPTILDRCTQDVIVSVETHAKVDKVSASRQSLQYVDKILHNYSKGADYVRAN